MIQPARAMVGRTSIWLVHPSHRTRGFSLIELLIVIAIILIIAAIAMPNLIRARMAANQTSGLSNLRTITTAAITYGNGYPPDLATLGGVGLATCNAAILLDDTLTPLPIARAATSSATRLKVLRYPIRRRHVQMPDSTRTLRRPSRSSWDRPGRQVIVAMNQASSIMTAAAFRPRRRPCTALPPSKPRELIVLRNNTITS